MAGGRDGQNIVVPHFPHRHFTHPLLTTPQECPPPRGQVCGKGLLIATVDIPHFEHRQAPNFISSYIFILLHLYFFPRMAATGSAGAVFRNHLRRCKCLALGAAPQQRSATKTGNPLMRPALAASTVRRFLR